MNATRMTLDLVAVGAVIAVPFVVIAVARWAARGPDGRNVPVEGWLVPVVSFLSGAAGLIHLLVIEEHLAESALHGLLFAVLAAFQLLWAVAYPARPRAWLGWTAVAVNLGAIAFWIVSRTTGLPGWLDGDGIEAVALADLASSAFELGVVVGLLVLLWRPMPERVARGLMVTRADAGLRVAMVVLATTLLTLGAIAEIAAGGHAHADGEGHAGNEAHAGAEAHPDGEAHAGAEAHPGNDAHAGAEAHLDGEAHAGAEAHPGNDAHAGAAAHPEGEAHPGSEAHAGAEAHLDGETHTDVEAHAGAGAHAGDGQPEG